MHDKNNVLGEQNSQNNDYIRNAQNVQNSQNDLHTQYNPNIKNSNIPPKESQQPHQSTEYSYAHENIPHPSYMDANYIPQAEDNAPHSSYYAQPQRQKKPKKEKKQGGGFSAKWIAICLVCAILGGIGGGFLSFTIMSSNSSSSNTTTLKVAEPNDASKPDIKTVASGEQLEPSDVYSLGCEQAVGITSEITVTNYFGMQSPAAISGSGFIVSDDGYIVTNYHVIKDAYEGGYDINVILHNGDSYPAKVIGGEEDNDIAVLKIEVTGLTSATLGDSDGLRVGDNVYAVGNPLGELNFSMTTGAVSARDRDITTSDQVTGKQVTNSMFQIDAAVNEGNSGGPLYNDRGEVIGVVTAKYSATGVEGIGFAIPMNDVTDIVSDLIKNGYVSGKPSFGIVVTDVDSVNAQYFNMVQGAYVYTINKDSCSEKAGLKVGDIITALNDKQVTSTTQLNTEKREYKAGDTVILTVYREGEYVDINVVLDEQVSANIAPPTHIKLPSAS